MRAHAAERARMGQTQCVFLPPWVPTTEAEKAHEDAYREEMLGISASARNLLVPHATAQRADFCFDWDTHRPFAEAAYREDRRLWQLLPRLVPTRVSEEDFWRNYFSHVFAVKSKYDAHKAGAPPVGGASAPADAPSAASVCASLPYPQKYLAARKYTTDGPPLPNVSDADTILLEALRRQVRVMMTMP